MHPFTVMSLCFAGLAAANTVPMLGREATNGEKLQTCRNIPGDKGWPSAATWQSLNKTVEGRLIAAQPIAHVCHAPSYSEAACSALKGTWNTGKLMSLQPVDIQAPWFQNQTCVPFTDPSQPCELGNLASYSINVTGVDDIKAGLKFAKKNNVRLAIKNSGHDWNGKSTGRGALSLWTRNMVSQEIVSYKSSFYRGPALKAGAGVTGGQAAQFAAAHGYRVVTGDSPTVGVAGGFTQGGGHSQLSGLYGVGADNVLEWEVVTPEGKHLVANPTKNSDLYWALSGGGGGTYGVVVSMTARLFADGQISSAALAFDVGSTGGVEEFWDAVSVFHDELQRISDSDGVVGALLLTNASLTVFSITAPGHTADSLSALLQPMESALSRSGKATLTKQSMGMTVTQGSGFYDLYSKTLMPLMDSVTEGPVMGGRMVLRENMASNKSAVIDAFRAATDGGRLYLASTALNTVGPAMVAGPVAANAVQSEWRDAFLSINIISSEWDWNQDWAEAAVRQDDMVRRVLPAMEAATPGSAVYLNEGNWAQPNWQRAFYGANYEKLLQIKNKYDPQGLLYALTAVGSEAWGEDAQGRLCRTGK